MKSSFFSWPGSNVTSEPPQQQGTAEALGPYCQLSALVALRWAAKTLALPTSKRVSRPQTGSHHSRFRGRGMEFSEVRAYQAGDDVRSIDWRVTARRQKPHTKLFNEERERPVFVICDQSQSQFFGSQTTFKSVRAAEAAALFAWTALANNDRVGGVVFSEHGHKEQKPARSRKSILRLLSTITRFNHALTIEKTAESAQGTFGLNQALGEITRLVKPGTLVVLISDFHHLDRETEKHLSRIAQHNELILLRTYDPLEEKLPGRGVYPISNGEEILVVDANAARNRDQYSDWAQQHRMQLEALATKFRAHLIQCSTHTPATTSLQAVLSHLGR